MAQGRIAGSCACGGISYTSTATPQHLDYCYCRTCQQVSGAPFMAWTGIAKSALKWKFGTKPFVYRSTVGDTGICIADRTCCGICGCNISLQYYLYPEKTHVAASTIREGGDDLPKVGCHIWTRHVPGWHNLPDDGVERYEEFDAVYKKLLEDYMSNLNDS